MAADAHDDRFGPDHRSCRHYTISWVDGGDLAVDKLPAAPAKKRQTLDGSVHPCVTHSDAVTAAIELVGEALGCDLDNMEQPLKALWRVGKRTRKSDHRNRNQGAVLTRGFLTQVRCATQPNALKRPRTYDAHRIGAAASGPPEW